MPPAKVISPQNKPRKYGVPHPDGFPSSTRFNYAIVEGSRPTYSNRWRGCGEQALGALADAIHLAQHLIVLLHIRLECLLVEANVATPTSTSGNSARGRRW